MKIKKPSFNLLIVGTGGQGLITLLKIVADAALFEGYEVRTSELHGLSQRGGSVKVECRFGKKFFSPLIFKKDVDLILGLELAEVLRLMNTGVGKKTKFLVNKKLVPYPGSLEEKKIVSLLKNAEFPFYLVEASKICKKEFGYEVLAGIFLLGLAVYNHLLPLKAQSLLLAIESNVPSAFVSLNKKAFSFAQNYGL